MPAPFWSTPIETLLTAKAADGNRLHCGANRSPDTRKITPFGLLRNPAWSSLVIILLFPMTLSLSLGETTDGA